MKAVDKFDISETGTRVALVEYSTFASVQLTFSDLTNAQLNAANVKRKIQGIPQTRGYTYINRALKLANTKIFTEANGMRKDAIKVNPTFCVL